MKKKCSALIIVVMVILFCFYGNYNETTKIDDVVFGQMNSKEETIVSVSSQMLTIKQQKLKSDSMYWEGTIKNNGVVLSGDFEGNKLVYGKVIIKKLGNKYTFSIDEGKFDKSVKIKYKNGAYFKGKFKHNKLNGKGTMKYKNGDKYSGKWKKGRRSGKGTYKWKKGGKYIGHWKKDKMNGKGTYYYGKKTKGKWLKGKFKKNKPLGKMLYKTKKGVKYKTYWKKGKCKRVTR